MATAMQSMPPAAVYCEIATSTGSRTFSNHTATYNCSKEIVSFKGINTVDGLFTLSIMFVVCRIGFFFFKVAHTGRIRLIPAYA